MAHLRPIILPGAKQADFGGHPMNFSREDFDWAVSEGLITAGQAEALWKALESRSSAEASGSPPPAEAAESTPSVRPKFTLINVTYFFGALLIIGAMSVWMTAAWEAFGGGGIFLISLAYMAGLTAAGWYLWHKMDMKIPGGLLVTAAVAITPLAIYGLEKHLDIWPQGYPGTYRGFYIWVKGGWFHMEAGTIIAGLVALRFFRFPFLTAPIAFTLWFMSMDLTPLLFGGTGFLWKERLAVSVWFGFSVLLASFFVDRRTKEDFAFWGYLFGMLAFWIGLSEMNAGGEFGKFSYFMINAGLIVVSVILNRKVFIVFGGLGASGYIGYLSFRLFKDSVFFPFLLSLAGIVVIVLAVLCQRNYRRIERAILDLVPESVSRLLPGRSAQAEGALIWRNSVAVPTLLAASILMFAIVVAPRMKWEGFWKAKAEIKTPEKTKPKGGESKPSDQERKKASEEAKRRKKASGTQFAPEKRLLARVERLSNSQKYTEAVPLAKKLTQVWKNKKGADHPEYARSLIVLAGLHHHTRQFEKAESLYKQSLGIFEKSLGKEHLEVANTLYKMSAVYLPRRRYAEAEPLLLRALSIREKNLGRNHVLVVQTLNRLIATLQMGGKWSEAAPYQKRVQEIR
jgi:hypothetical protein